MILYIVNGLYFLVESIYNSPSTSIYRTMSYVIVENKRLDETRQQSTINISTSTLEFIEIPDSCVEYTGRIMSGEIVKTPDKQHIKEIEFAYETTQSLKKSQTIPNTTREYCDMRPPSTIIYKDKPSPINHVLRHIYDTHIHICECITAFSCCSTS